MIPIGPYPILWHIMQLYANHGFNDFIICLGYKGEIIKNFFFNYQSRIRDFTINLSNNEIIYHSDGNSPDWNVTLVDTGLHTMTGGRISKIRKYVDEDNFMLTYGDGISDLNINQLLDYHNNHGKILTVTGVRPPGRFGEMVDKNGAVIEFNEKPQSEKGRISGGFFVANTKIFSYLSDHEGLVFEKEPISNLVNDEELMMFKHDGFWQPMDTSREYKLLNDLFNENNAPWIK
mgnify:CR=1 FL=1